MKREHVLSGSIDKLLEKSEIDVDELYILLTPLERTILKTLASEKRPLTVNEIRNLLIEDFERVIESWNPNLFVIEESLEELDPDIIELGARRRVKKLGPDFSKLRFWEGRYDLDLKTLELIKEEISEIKPRYKKIRKLGELLKKHSVADIPAFATIEKVLNEFAAMGLVLSRNEVVGRGKKLYVINPRILDKLTKLFN
jgi:hypothetical protein